VKKRPVFTNGWIKDIFETFWVKPFRTTVIVIVIVNATISNIAISYRLMKGNYRVKTSFFEYEAKEIKAPLEGIVE
jgi:hypothetical protein